MQCIQFYMYNNKCMKLELLFPAIITSSLQCYFM